MAWMSQWTIMSGLDSKSKALIFCFWSSLSANLKLSYRFQILQDLSLFLMYGFMMPSIKFEARIMLAGCVGVRVYACSTKCENFEMYSCMAKSVCLNVVNLCLAVVEFPHSENLSRERGFIADQCLPDKCSFLTYLWSDPLEVAKGTLSGSLQEMVEILITSSNHALKPRAVLPSHVFALFRQCSFETVTDCLKVSWSTLFCWTMDFSDLSIRPIKLLLRFR